MDESHNYRRYEIGWMGVEPPARSLHFADKKSYSTEFYFCSNISRLGSLKMVLYCCGYRVRVFALRIFTFSARKGNVGGERSAENLRRLASKMRCHLQVSASHRTSIT